MKLALPAVLLLAIATLATPAPARAATSIDAKTFLAEVLAGQPVTGKTITGAVSLNARTIKQPIICRNCTFANTLTGTGATFDDVADFAGSTFESDVSFSGATFTGPALFGAPGADAAVTTFDGKADFSLATFSAVASFENTDFDGVPDFTLAKFGSQTSFASGVSLKADLFTRAIFKDAVDFSDHNFRSTVDFGGTDFAAPADFSNVTFTASATFDRARFEKGATFLVASFPIPPKTDSYGTDTFDEVQSGGDLNFSYASISREADFEDVTVAGTISFHGATLAAPKDMQFSDVTATGIDMSVGDATRAVDPGDLTTVLGLIESGAKTRGDLGVANDAHYEHQVLDSHKDSWPVRILDYVFYRTFAGYFVRPLQPLFTLLLFAALVTAYQVRQAKPRPARAERRGSPRRHVSLAGLRRAWRDSGSPFVNGYLQTLELVGVSRAVADERAARKIEVFLYRLLFLCALIGFANSNPTLRQMFDAIR